MNENNFSKWHIKDSTFFIMRLVVIKCLSSLMSHLFLRQTFWTEKHKMNSYFALVVKLLPAKVARSFCVVFKPFCFFKGLNYYNLSAAL